MHYCGSLFLKPFGQQAAHPAVCSQAVEPRYDGAARRIAVFMQQRGVVVGHLFRHGHLRLSHPSAVARYGVAVNLLDNMQHNVVIPLVAVVPVGAPC